MTTIDLKLFYFLNDLAGQYHFFDNLVIFFASYLQYFLIVVFALLLFFSQYPKFEKIYIFLACTGSGIIGKIGVTELIRFFYHRPRPFVEHTVNKLLSTGLFYADTEWSFPSGHSTFFFAMAMTIYLYNKKWGTGFFIAAFFINISRIIAGVHYPSDILGGFVIGLLLGYIIYILAEKYKSKLISVITQYLN